MRALKSALARYICWRSLACLFDQKPGRTFRRLRDTHSIMSRYARWTICTCTAAALLSAAIATAQAQSAQHPDHAKKAAPPAAAAPAQLPKLPPRTPFTAADDATAVIAGMPDARFWADSA